MTVESQALLRDQPGE